jgi:hypothetical protein
MVKSLIKKLSGILAAEFQGASIELEKSGLGKIAGFLIWSGFKGVEQITRQERLWKVLENKLTSNELLQVSAILTITPEEKPVPQRVQSKRAG